MIDQHGVRWLTVKEFAARMGMTDHAVRKWLRKGGLPHLEKGEGRPYLIPEDALDRLYQQQEG